jgi:hypothetical protein
METKKRGYKWSATDQDRWRAKIADAKVIQGMMDAWQGKRELSQTQLTIGLKCMDKLIPNLQATAVEVTETQPFAVLPAIVPDHNAWQHAFKPGLPKGETEH